MEISRNEGTVTPLGAGWRRRQSREGQTGVLYPKRC